MKISLLIIGLVIVGMIAGVLLVTRGLEIGNPPNIAYFDAYSDLMPGHTLNRLPFRCSTQDSFGSYYEDTSYYCTDVDPNFRYINISEHNGIITYLSIGTHNLRYGDLVATYGYPTEIRRSRNGRIVSVHFDCVYSLVVDKMPPLMYTSYVSNVGFSEC